MSLRINDEAPNFKAKTTQGEIDFHKWIGDGWAILFSHPKDFTPVCTTELGYMAKLEPEFKKRNCKIIGLSVDPVDNHDKWAKDIEETQGAKVNYQVVKIVVLETISSAVFRSTLYFDIVWESRSRVAKAQCPSFK